VFKKEINYMNYIYAPSRIRQEGHPQRENNNNPPQTLGHRPQKKIGENEDKTTAPKGT
jgi:hypothetical protein